MLQSMKKTINTAGVRGLFDGISGTWLRQMSYSLCRFWAYDESKKIVGAGKDIGQYFRSWELKTSCRQGCSGMETRAGGQYGCVVLTLPICSGNLTRISAQPVELQAWLGILEVGT